MKKIAKILLFSSMLLFFCIFATGCFVLNMLFPFPGKGSANLAVFIHYKNINLANHEIVSVEFFVNEIGFTSIQNTIAVNKSYIVAMNPQRTIERLADLFIESIQLGQFTFDNPEEKILNPTLSVTLGSQATVTYMKYVETEDIAEATTIVFNLVSTSLAVKVKTLSNTSFSDYADITLPRGQSKLLLLFDLSAIPPLASVPLSGTPSFSLAKTISMISKDICYVFGDVNDLTSAGTLHKGQHWTSAFDDSANLLFEDGYWGFATYSVEGSLKHHRYFFLAPQISNQTYTVFFEWYVPENNTAAGQKTFDISDVDEMRVDISISQVD